MSTSRISITREAHSKSDAIQHPPIQDQISSQKTPHFRSGEEPYEPKGVQFLLERDSRKQTNEQAVLEVPLKNWNPELEMIARQPRTESKVLTPFIQSQPFADSTDHHEPDDLISSQKQQKSKASIFRSGPNTQNIPRQSQIEPQRKRIEVDHPNSELLLRARKEEPELASKPQDEYLARNQRYYRIGEQDRWEYPNFDLQASGMTSKHNQQADRTISNNSHDYRSNHYKKGASNWIDESLSNMYQQVDSVRILEDEVRKTGPAADSRVNNIIEKLLQSPLDATGESMSRTPIKLDPRAVMTPDYSLSGHKTPSQRRVAPIPYNQLREEEHQTPTKSVLSTTSMKPAREGGVLSLLVQHKDQGLRQPIADNFMHEGEQPKMAQWAGWDDRRLPPRPSDEAFQPLAGRYGTDILLTNQHKINIPSTTWNYNQSTKGYETLPEKYLARVSQSTSNVKNPVGRVPAPPFRVETNIQQANILKNKHPTTALINTNSRRITALGQVLTSDSSRSPPRSYTQYASGSSTHRDYKNPYSRHLS